MYWADAKVKINQLKCMKLHVNLRTEFNFLTGENDLRTEFNLLTGENNLRTEFNLRTLVITTFHDDRFFGGAIGF